MPWVGLTALGQPSLPTSEPLGLRASCCLQLPQPLPLSLSLAAVFRRVLPSGQLINRASEPLGLCCLPLSPVRNLRFRTFLPHCSLPVPAHTPPLVHCEHFPGESGSGLR